MKIAILGWGSLVWNPGDLAISHDGWHSDGPLLPIEFARISGHGNAPPRLTLVLRADAEYVQTQWAQSSHEELARAIDNLAAREKTVEAKIGYLKSGSDSMGDRSRLTALAGSDIAATEGTATAANVLDRIDWWREQQGLDAVIWTDLGSNFEERHGSLSRQNVVAYLRSLSARGFAAEEYVRRAPRQTRTKIRRLLEHDLGWLPTPASRIGPDDPSFQKEWAECRTTIGRLDTILEDLRKLGFSFITALLTAGAILSFLGIQSVDKVPVPPAPTRAAPFLSIVVLIVALFFLDCYYEVLLSAAVERALDIETQTDPPVRLTKYLGINAGHSGATVVTLLLYLFLLATACGLGVLGSITETTSNGRVTTVSFLWSPFAFVIIGIGLVVGFAMFLYWRYLGIKTGVHTIKSGRPWPAGESPTDKIAIR